MARLAELLEPRRTAKPRYLVGIDGPDAAGKTVLARELASRLAPAVVQTSIDAFHRPRTERHARGPDSADVSYNDTFATDTFCADLLEPFRTGAPEVRIASLDTAADRPIAPIAEVPPRALLLIDGVFLQRPELRGFWDLVVYLDIPPEVSKARGVPRDLIQGGDHDQLVAAYEQRYLPGQALYRAECDPLSRADILIENSDPNQPVILRWPE